MKIKRALISVSDKTGLDELVKGLDELGVEILSTGGTASKIASAGVKVTEVSAYTGFPEMLDGRVKTLHPKIHGGLLALRDNKEHMSQLREHGIGTIDMVVVNLYPFEKTVSQKNVKEEDAIENIDIGGPSMLRSAAKNFRSVAVVSSVDQYKDVLSEMRASGASLSEETLKALAVRVFETTSKYDSAIAGYLSSGGPSGVTPELPDSIRINLRKERQLRYGENPHQKAALYRDILSPKNGISWARQIQGKELSFNNLLDLNAAYEMVNSFSGCAVSVVKHNNPCGIAEAPSIEKAYIDALECDKLSAFGSIMGFNRPIGEKLAGVVLEEADFIECVIAPDYDDDALRIFSRKKNLRVLKASYDGARARLDIKNIDGGALVQEKDDVRFDLSSAKVVTEKAPSAGTMASLAFGWQAVKFVKSNAIVLCNGTKTVGIGAGQMSRVDSVIIAVMKAGKRSSGATLASDAFFPKADSIEEAHKAGISAIIQPGGSIRDQEVIDACNRYGIPMVFTGVRHFRH